MKVSNRPGVWEEVAVLTVVATACLAACGPAPTSAGVVPAPRPTPREAAASDVAPSQDGVALAIVYDTSGSMRDSVRNASGKFEPKSAIAGRALAKVLDRLKAFQATHAAKPLEVELLVFAGKDVVEIAPLAAYDDAGLRRRAASLGTPTAETPLGEGLEAAARAVLASKQSHRHVLIVTDGVNTAGPAPEVVLPALQERGRRAGSGISVHFVAFDVEAKLFDPVKKLGATVVAATDERTLEDRIGSVLETKILLEEEEPARPRER